MLGDAGRVVLAQYIDAGSDVHVPAAEQSWREVRKSEVLKFYNAAYLPALATHAGVPQASRRNPAAT
jgi:hypothetical protein